MHFVPSPADIRVRKNILFNTITEDQKNLSEKNDKRDQFLKVGHYRARSKDSLLLTAVTNLVSTLMNFDETISKR